jgi:hypothetical protein
MDLSQPQLRFDNIGVNIGEDGGLELVRDPKEMVMNDYDVKTIQVKHKSKKQKKEGANSEVYGATMERNSKNADNKSAVSSLSN